MMLLLGEAKVILVRQSDNRLRNGRQALDRGRNIQGSIRVIWEWSS